MGVEIVCNVIIGKTLTLDELFGKMGYAAVFIGTGAGLPQFLGIPGENLNGVMSANEFLTRVNLMRGYKFPEADTPVRVGKRVAVIGAGNTAMDAVRTSLRMGAEEAMIVYRRSEKEMSARVEEYHHAKEEGVQFHWLTNPLEVVGNADGWVTGLRCQKMKLGRAGRLGPRAPGPDCGQRVRAPGRQRGPGDRHDAQSAAHAHDRRACSRTRRAASSPTRRPGSPRRRWCSPAATR